MTTQPLSGLAVSMGVDAAASSAAMAKRARRAAWLSACRQGGVTGLYAPFGAAVCRGADSDQMEQDTEAVGDGDECKLEEALERKNAFALQSKPNALYWFLSVQCPADARSRCSGG